MHPRQWSDLHGWIFMYWEWEKTFADCSLLSCQEMPRHQTSWRKLSQIATKPQNSQKFSLSNFPCHMACTIKLCLPLMSHMIKGTGLSPSIAQGRAWEWGYTKTTCRHRVLNHTPGRLIGKTSTVPPFTTYKICPSVSSWLGTCKWEWAMTSRTRLTN